MLKCLIAIAIRAKKVSVSSCHAEWPEMLNLSVILSLKRFENISLFGSKICFC